MTAVVVFAIAIGTAAASGMAPKQHRTVGYVVFGLLILQVIGGSILAWSWSKQAGDSKLTEKQMKLGGLAHRTFGVVALALVAWQYFSASDDEGAVARLNTDHDVSAYRDGAITWTALIGFVIALSFVYYDPVRERWTSSKKTEITDSMPLDPYYCKYSSTAYTDVCIYITHYINTPFNILGF